MADNRLAGFVKKAISYFAESLTDLPSRDATLHIHNAVASSGWDTSDAATGQLVSQKAGNKGVAVRSDAHTSVALARCIGVVTGSGWVAHQGLVKVQFKTGLTVSEGDPVYVGVTADKGNATNVLPAATGDFDVLLGTITDTSSYATDSTCIVLLAPPVGVLPAAHA